jgi:hypothetical protein
MVVLRVMWRPYVAHGRKQFRIGVWRQRKDRLAPEYRFVGIEWQW